MGCCSHAWGKVCVMGPACLVALLPAMPAPGQEAEAVVPAAERLTLMMMIAQGGPVLWVLMGLGVLTLALALFLLTTLTVRREAPTSLIKRAHSQIVAGDLRGAYQMCLERDEMMANVLRAGLKMSGHDRYVIQEAMESAGERAAASLWQRITYLNNIANLALLLGLLGTVWGMMQAFGAIAFDTAQVRSMSMAYSVSEAMITTAAGLILAIPTMAVYFFLRGRVIKIVAAVEAHATEFIELLTRSRQP